jgi:hypothetical protein
MTLHLFSDSLPLLTFATMRDVGNGKAEEALTDTGNSMIVESILQPVGYSNSSAESILRLMISCVIHATIVAV